MFVFTNQHNKLHNEAEHEQTVDRHISPLSTHVQGGSEKVSPALLLLSR